MKPAYNAKPSQRRNRMTNPPTETHGLIFYEGSHRYRLGGEWVPSGTTIPGVLDNTATPQGAAPQVAEYVAATPDGIDTLRVMGRGPMVQALKGIPWAK